MGDHSFLENYVTIRKYRNRFHIWYQIVEQEWLFFFRDEYDNSILDHKPKKLIIWEE